MWKEVWICQWEKSKEGYGWEEGSLSPRISVKVTIKEGLITRLICNRVQTLSISLTRSHYNTTSQITFWVVAFRHILMFEWRISSLAPSSSLPRFPWCWNTHWPLLFILTYLIVYPEQCIKLLLCDHISNCFPVSPVIL